MSQFALTIFPDLSGHKATEHVTEHERAQLAWAELINGLGGDARFANRGDEV